MSRSIVEFARQRVGPAVHVPGLVAQLISALPFAREHVAQLSLQRTHQSAGGEGSACSPPAKPNRDVRTRPIWTRRRVKRAMVSSPSMSVARRGRAITPMALVTRAHAFVAPRGTVVQPPRSASRQWHTSTLPVRTPPRGRYGHPPPAILRRADPPSPHPTRRGADPGLLQAILSGCSVSLFRLAVRSANHP